MNFFRVQYAMNQAPSSFLAFQIPPPPETIKAGDGVSTSLRGGSREENTGEGAARFMSARGCLYECLCFL